MPTISVSGMLASSNAGDISIELSDNRNSTINVKGSHRATIPVNEKLTLLAVGGNGIDGRIGANGHDGATGTDGADADRYGPGGNGGPGGDGGHGEAGTHGGPAGNGGKVDVYVKHEDLALLDIISAIKVSPGIPGKAGKHGAGGRGGRGGRGGSPYSWSVPYTVERTEHWWDGQGNIHNRVVSDTHYNYYNSPGGSNGPDGADGGAYTYPLYSGAVGSSGKIQFHVAQEGENSLHAEPYKLVTRNIVFRSAEGGGLWEPGDLITAYYEIENQGATMISPPELIPLILENGEHLELVKTGTIAGNIKAGTTHLSEPTPLQFRIKEPRRHTGSEPYKLSAEVMVAAQNTRLQQPFQHSRTKDVLTVQYPAQLEPQTFHFSIAENESQLLQATVKNIGAKNLGKLAGRELFVEITAVDTQSSLVSEDVSLLESQNRHQISYREQFDPGTELGEHQTYHMNLYLQPIDRSDAKTLIQRQTIIGQLSPKYSPPTNKFILVINGNTTKEQIRYWTNFLSQLSGNNEVAIWNTSYYQQLNLDGNPNLLADAAHGTVIILDDLFPNAANQPQHNTQHISKAQLLKASQQHDVSLVALGTNAPTQPFANSDFVAWPDPKLEYDSLKALMTALLCKDTAQPISLHQVTIPLKQRWFCRGREETDKALAMVIYQLQEVFPNRTYHVRIAENDEQQVTINVRRLADRLEQNIRQIPLSNDQLAHPQHNHETIQSGILGALSFSQKFELFTQQGNPYHQHLARALTKDLLDEQAIVMRTEAYGTLLERILRKNRREFSLELKNLRQLLSLLEQFVQQGDFANVQAWSPLVIRLMAEVQYHAKQHSSFWTRFIHWLLPQINEQILASTLELSNKILDLQNTYSSTPIPEITAAVQRQEAILSLANQLKIFLQEDDAINPERCYGFFSMSKISVQEREAVQQLLRVRTEDAALDTLESYKQTMRKNPKIKKFSAEFSRLFPESAERINQLHLQ